MKDILHKAAQVRLLIFDVDGVLTDGSLFLGVHEYAFESPAFTFVCPGLAARLPIVRRFGIWVERNTIGQLRLYRAVKGLTSRFAEMDDQGQFKPALVRGPLDQRQFAYLMEDLGDGFAVVMLPSASVVLTSRSFSS